MPEKLTVGSLFSGIGGFELGLERTGGFKTVWQCEKNEFCLEVLAKHWPDVIRFTDIKEMKEDIPYVDVICGGFPCQDISCAGKGAGIHAERSGLWWEMLRIVRLVRPRYVLVENVAALLNRGLDEVLGSLAESGYGAEWCCLKASDFGGLHRRERIFIIAYSMQQGTLRLEEDQAFSGNRRGSGFLRSELQRQSTSLNAEGISDRPIVFTDDLLERMERHKQEQISKQRGFSWCEGIRSIEDITRRSDIPKPLICRKDDGFSGRMDRLRALGNAIVPQCSEFVGRCVLNSLEE